MERFVIKNLKKSSQWSIINTIKNIEDLCFPDAWSNASISNEMNNSNTDTFCVFDEDEIVAFALIMTVLDESSLLRIAVLPNYRKKGIASSLIKEIISFATKQGVCKINLEVRKSNLAAISLYEKNCFLKVGERKNYYKVGNTVDDALVFIRDL